VTVRDRLGALDRVQRTRRYKVIASVLVAMFVAAAAVAALYLHQQAVGGELEAAREAERAARAAFVEAQSDGVGEEEIRVRQDAWLAATRRASELFRERAQEGTLVGEGVLNWAFPGLGAFAALALAAVWLGLSLSYLGLLAVGGLAGLVVMFVPGLRGVGVFTLAALPLVVALLTLLEVARLALSVSHPVTAVARNVLSEAVRMKIGIVFIGFLVLLLAAVPLLLEPDQPLRFRVQQWLQYGTGLGYGVLVLLTAFFGCATVAFEQRDRRLWQTVTKPVAAWQYVLGKWVGVMVLNLVLLSVIASSVFMFTQYLRFQPAEGEIDAFVTEAGFDTRVFPGFMTDDRRKLENEVLVARVGVEPEPPEIPERAIEDRAERIVSERLRNQPGLERTSRVMEEAREQAREEFVSLSFSIPRNSAREYVFEGLGDVRDGPSGSSLTLRYRVNAGSNDPSAIYTLRFLFNGVAWPRADALNPGGSATLQPGVRQVGLDTVQLISFPPGLIDEDGELRVAVFNDPGNRWEVRLLPEDFEVVYPVGGYEWNFARAMAVLWVKLGFVAAVAVMCSTFLSFPVAVLVGLGVVFASESAGFLSESLDQFSSLTREGEVRYDRLVSRILTMPVAWLFEQYASLRPVERLTSGRLLSWGDVGAAVVQIAAWSALLLGIGVAVFRKRELALYSGK